MSLPARDDGSAGEQGPLRPRAADRPPSLEKYELLEELGHGGMATVYRARDPRLGREVAVKLIHKHLREDAEVGARFVAEARAAAKLRHPGIVEVYDVSTEQDHERYLVVELIRGTTLRKILQKHRDMPAEIGASVVLALCDALDHAHAAGIIHRDVKPENVLVELPADRPGAPDGAGVVIKLTDFGIAKILDAQGVTSTGQVLGSPAHMAPEQIEGGDVDPRTDVFALGVLLYECLVGHLPFEGKNPAQVLRRVLEGSYPEAERERPSVGGRWNRIIAGALAHSAADRVESPRALGELIRHELSALGVNDPRAEIAAYFAEPRAYTAAHAERLVPRLCARADAERKRGDVTGAAADYNRALALAPHDLGILKRVASLNSRSGRRRLARRIGAVVLGSLALGMTTFAVARALRPRPVLTADMPSVAAKQPSSSAPAAEPPPNVAVVTPTGVPAATSARSRGRPPNHTTFTATPPEPAGGVREVRFQIIPTGAKLVLDGKEVPWFGGRMLMLAVGAHAVQISVPNSKCCKPFAGSITVTPPGPGDARAPQRIVHRLDMMPSTVLLSGAPAGAQVSCPQIRLSGSAGSQQTVTLPDVTWSGLCEFTPATPGAEPRSQTVTLRAGEANTIVWPSR